MLARVFYLLIIVGTLTNIEAKSLGTGLGEDMTLSSNNDYISNAFGDYRLQLLTNCSLKLLHFNKTEQVFNQHSILTPANIPSQECESLTLSQDNRGLITDKNEEYLTLDPSVNYDRLTFKVTDDGKVVLGGEYTNAVGGSSEDKHYLPESLNNAINLQ